MKATAEPGAIDGGLMNVEQAAKYLCISVHTLYRYTSAKQVPHKKLGSRVLFEKQAIDRWLDSLDVLTIGKR